MSNIFIGLKKDLFGCFRIEEIHDNNNDIGLKEGGVIEMSTTVLSIYAMLAPSLKYSPSSSTNRSCIISAKILADDSVSRLPARETFSRDNICEVCTPCVNMARRVLR